MKYIFEKVKFGFHFIKKGKWNQYITIKGKTQLPKMVDSVGKIEQ